MREELKELTGLRWTFRGVFARFGRKAYRNYPAQTTVLLRDIQDATGKIVTDHLWFNLTKEFAALDLKEGERIQFDARARMYRKRLRDRDDEDQGIRHGFPRYELDYKLSHPTKVKRLEGEKQIEDLPLFRNSGQ